MAPGVFCKESGPGLRTSSTAAEAGNAKTDFEELSEPETGKITTADRTILANNA
jgi:hypothetical protein